MNRYKLLYNRGHCANCTLARNMAVALNEAGVDVEIDDNDRCPFTEHPIFYDGYDRLTGDEAIKKLAEIGGEKIKKHLEEKHESSD